MNSSATLTFEDTQTKIALLGHTLDSVSDIIGRTRTRIDDELGAFSRLQIKFNQTAGLPKSLLVVRAETNVDQSITLDDHMLMTNRASIVQQLSTACGINPFVSYIGNDEYAVLMTSVDVCTELLPCLEHITTRINQVNGSELELNCYVGVARCPIDADELNQLISMASRAAAELDDSGPRYQFISRQHRICSDTALGQVGLGALIH